MCNVRGTPRRNSQTEYWIYEDWKVLFFCPVFIKTTLYLDQFSCYLMWEFWKRSSPEFFLQFSSFKILFHMQLSLSTFLEYGSFNFVVSCWLLLLFWKFSTFWFLFVWSLELFLVFEIYFCLSLIFISMNLLAVFFAIYKLNPYFLLRFLSLLQLICKFTFRSYFEWSPTSIPLFISYFISYQSWPGELSFDIEHHSFLMFTFVYKVVYLELSTNTICWFSQ